MAATFVVAMNRVDVVEIVVDLVDVDLDVGLVDVGLDVDLVDVDLVDIACVFRQFLFLASCPLAVFLVFGLQLLYSCWPPAVFKILASGCSGCFSVRLLLWLSCMANVHAHTKAAS